MRTTHTPLPFADHTLHVVEFEPGSFHEHDLLWLPHHAQLTSAGRKRKMEHLAGRIAAVHALREHSDKTVPGIGKQRQPLWPHGMFGSISHSASTALAVVSDRPIGLDIEAIFAPQTATELESSIVSNTEKMRLTNSGLPFEQALTLAFSAKESIYKAFYAQTTALPGFASAHITALTTTQLTLRILPAFSVNLAGQDVCVHWRQRDKNIITLCTGFPPGERY